MVSFSDLGVSRELVRALANQGIDQPFEVQTESIPDGMLGNDLCCRAPTGSGKTLAFGLPLIERWTGRTRLSNLVNLTPTRELGPTNISGIRPPIKELGLFYAVLGGAFKKIQGFWGWVTY
ncbi:MAG: hypothetical protein CM15mP2_0280 [Methanobacteriota archaeon]|nr:MAG: hypothetical protein CM15mP2_0280 [Euryarchaeota archaeon]